MSDDPRPHPRTRKHAPSRLDAAGGVSYCPVTNDADPGDAQRGRPEPRSGGPCGKSLPATDAAAATVAPPTSLDALETSPHPLPDQTRPQLSIHAPFADARAAVWRAFATSQGPCFQRRADRLARCCAFPALRTRPSGELVLCPQRCRDRCCPHCATHRARETGERVLTACRRMDAVRFITLTVPHVDAWLDAQIAALRAAFSRLRRSASWRAHVTGGVYGFEVKISRADGRWHPHLHVIADGRFYPLDELREAWRFALRHPESPWNLGDADPLIVHVEAVHNRRDVARYVGKYVAKPADLASWHPVDILAFAAAMHGQRLIHAFGSLHGLKLEQSDPNEDPATTTHVASIQTLNIAAGRRQHSARVALLLFRLVFPKQAAWTRPGLKELAPAYLRDGESLPNALARIAASAEREFWNNVAQGHSPAPKQATRRPPPPCTMPLPYTQRTEDPP